MKEEALTENQNTFSGRAYIEKFCRHLKNQGFRPATAANHLGNLVYYRKFLEAQNKTVETVDTGTVSAYQTWLLNYKTRAGKPLAVNSQMALLSSLNVFYRLLHQNGHILNNPTQTLCLPKERRTLPQILTPREMKKLLGQPDLNTVSGFRDRAMLELLYCSGIRIGELLALKVEHLKVSEKSLHIIEGKGGKDRLVPVGKTASAFLQNYITDVRPLLIKAPTELLLLNRFGRAFGVSGILKKLKQYAHAARIEKNVTVHTFRHTLASDMLRKGAELRHIQELLGHESLKTTERYLHIVKTELRRAQAKHHPREALELPEGIITYRGLK